MKVVRFSAQVIFIIMLVGAVFAVAVPSNYENVFFSPLNSYEDKIEPLLLENFESLEQGETIRGIINFRVNGEVPENDAVAREVIERVGIPEDRVRGVIAEAADVYLTEGEVYELARESYVVFVQLVHYAKPLLNDVDTIVDAVSTWPIEIGGTGLTGEGVGVCVVDTGVDVSHPDLENKVLFGCNLFCNGEMFEDCELDCQQTDIIGHGTHVAGIVGANGGVYGVGKGVGIISLKVISDGNFSASEIQMVQAVEWCIANKENYNIKAVSMSLGDSTPNSDYCDNTGFFLTGSINAAFDAGLPTVISTGNDGSSSGITWPACIEKAIPVSSTDKFTDERSDFANYNWMVKLFSPGRDVTSTCSSYAGCNVGDYTLKSGTSMSAPAVSASFAMISQFLEFRGESMTPYQIENLLHYTGEEVVGLSDSWKRINVHSAIMSLDSSAPSLSLVSPTNRQSIPRNFALIRNYKFNCVANDLSGIDKVDLYIYEGLGENPELIYTQTQEFSGERDADALFSIAEEVFTSGDVPSGQPSIDLDTRTYQWSCEGFDALGNSQFASSNNILYIKWS